MIGTPNKQAEKTKTVDHCGPFTLVNNDDKPQNPHNLKICHPCLFTKTMSLATKRDPWATNLQVSVAKEGKVFDQKKPLQPFLYTHEGTEMGCIIFFYKFDYDGLL